MNISMTCISTSNHHLALGVDTITMKTMYTDYGIHIHIDYLIIILQLLLLL